MFICTNKNKVVTVEMDRGRSNPINMEFVQQMTALFEDMATDDAIDGVILTGKEHFFSVGLDLIELYDYDKATINKFWIAFTKLNKTLAGFPKPMVAAITGHSPAGGCIFAICADYRIMAEGKYKIGLNEVPVGIVLPYYVFALYSYWLGKRTAYNLLLEGKLLLAEEAFDVGLVDELVPYNEVLAKANEKINSFLKYSKTAWRQSKLNLRKDILEAFEFDIEGDIDKRMEQWWAPETRAIMNEIVQKLTAK